MRVKICGITRVEDALAAEAAGADAVGLVFADSKRRVSLEQAAAIDAALGPLIARVGVFVNAPLAQVEEALARLRLTAVQLHGEEDAAYASRLKARVRMIKAFSFRPELDTSELRHFPADAVLLDAPSPGGGKPFDWRAASSLVALPRLILAGGLMAANVTEAVQALRPYAVDVSSGVESRPGIKDASKIQDFVQAAKEAAQREVLSTVIHS
jgi:phosphoribosylanthranilate isomerase